MPTPLSFSGPRLAQEKRGHHEIKSYRAIPMIPQGKIIPFVHHQFIVFVFGARGKNRNVRTSIITGQSLESRYGHRSPIGPHMNPLNLEDIMKGGIATSDKGQFPLIQLHRQVAGNLILQPQSVLFTHCTDDAELLKESRHTEASLPDPESCLSRTVSDH